MRYDWNSPGLSFKGKTVGPSAMAANGVLKYDVALDDLTGMTLVEHPSGSTLPLKQYQMLLVMFLLESSAQSLNLLRIFWKMPTKKKVTIAVA